MISRSVFVIGARRGGVATHLRDLVNGISARDWDVHFFDIRQPFCSPPITAPRNVTVIPVNPSFTTHGATVEDFARILHESANALLLNKAVQLLDTLKTPPALIHCHDYHGFDAAVQLSELLHVPLVTTVHLLHEPMARWGGENAFRHCIVSERSMCERSDAVIAVSKSLQQLLHATHPCSRGRTVVIPNGVDLNASSKHNRWEDPSGARSRLGLEQKRVILYVGRFTPQKNLDALLDSAVRVVSSYPDVVYVLAGDDRNHPYVHELRRFVQEHAVLRSAVRFIGDQSSDQLAALYAIATLLLVPSRYEGLPYCALEAMAAAVPVVAAATIGLSDLIEHRISGLLVPVIGHAMDNEQALHARRELDTGQLAEAQMEILGNGALAAALGLAGRQRILMTFTKEMMIEATVSLYETLADRDTVSSNAIPAGVG